MYNFAESQQKMALQSRSETTDLIFLYFDANGDGYLSYSEWQNLCWTSDPYMSSSDISLYFNYIDANGDNYLSWGEIYNVVQ